ncbi:hypothetical protein RXV94_12130 [Yeosuana sp. MJ-SS3]|uniref:Uncharacterized protein n=1 Tax=Gilvirhabdus luticola TaxID=3079858 RepID=A0ABU3U919_9FLAO|nr:hypothetical protein [Yeosuana sp. MJ-SS3]MDU8886912.1 hypothetical protein [Yeosuana sp. MJ-SS3]
MRTNNGKVKNIIISVYFVLVLLAIVLITVFSAFREVSKNPTMLLLTMLLGFIIVSFIVHRISKYFEYDSDGVKVVLINKGLLLSEYFNYREHIVEFDKPKLVSFKFNNYIIFKELVLYIKDRKDKVHKHSFNVTLVQRKKRKYIKQSLRKMIKENRKKENE